MSCFFNNQVLAQLVVLNSWKESEPTECVRVVVFPHESDAGAALCVQEVGDLRDVVILPHQLLTLLDVLSFETLS